MYHFLINTIIWFSETNGDLVRKSISMSLQTQHSYANITIKQKGIHITNVTLKTTFTETLVQFNLY